MSYDRLGEKADHSPVVPTTTWRQKMSLDLPNRVAENIAHLTGRAWLLEPVLDWLEKSSRRLFILTGEPGAGKSMIAAWPAGGGPLPAAAEQRARLERIRAAARGAHFCEAASGKTAPKALAKSLAEQLQDAIPPFGQALLKTLKERMQITAMQDIETVAAGGTAIVGQDRHLQSGPRER